VSIITPAYNAAQFLEGLIISVQAQDYPHFEHIVIDDGSTDDGATMAVLKRFPHVRWWSRENAGQYATMNEGLLAAQGDIVCFVSSDDIVSPGAISAVVNYLSKNPDLDGVFGIASRIDSQGKAVPYFIPFRTAPISFYPYFAHISHCSLYVKKTRLVERNLMFEPSLRYVGDYDWIIRIGMEGLRIGLLRRELSKVRLHEDQMSKKFRNDSQVEADGVIKLRRINKLRYGILHSIYWILVKIWQVIRAVGRGDSIEITKKL